MPGDVRAQSLIIRAVGGVQGRLEKAIVTQAVCVEQRPGARPLQSSGGEEPLPVGQGVTTVTEGNGHGRRRPDGGFRPAIGFALQ
ncbi:hypothetical protein GCM10027294_07480 [Marinactinospora endophytica]